MDPKRVVVDYSSLGAPLLALKYPVLFPPGSSLSIADHPISNSAIDTLASCAPGLAISSSPAVGPWILAMNYRESISLLLQQRRIHGLRSLFTRPTISIPY